MRLIPVPGTGQSIELPSRVVDLSKQLGGLGGVIEVSGPLPIQFREIVKPFPASAHWLDKSFGPRLDLDGFVFLGRAIREIGSAMHGDDWTGQEPAVNMTLQPLPDRAGPMDFESKTVPSADKYAAIVLLGKGDPPRKSGWDWINEVEWRKAQALRAQAIAYVRPARERFEAITHALELAFAKGPLVARLQAAEGGSLGPEIGAANWHVPLTTLQHRFISCQMSATSLLGTGSTHWIFVNQSGLNKMLADHRKLEAEAAAKPKLTTTHLDAFMARVRDAVRARPDGPSERDALIEEGRHIYRLPKTDAERAFKDAVDTAGIPHNWSKLGPKKKK